MKITVNKNEDVIGEDTGILYLVYFRLDDKDLVKIGVTQRTIEERISEILVSIFKKYREFPYCRPKRFRKTNEIFEKEAILHKYFKDNHYSFDKKFSGCTEFFEIPLDTAVKVYENLLEGRELHEGIQETV